MVELTERRRPSVLCRDEPGDQTTHFIPPRRVYPQSVHSGVKFGDNFRALCYKFVDKPVVGTRAPTVHFVLPEGAD